MSASEFRLVGTSEATETFTLKEPLISMLLSMNDESLRFTLDKLNDYSKEVALDETMPEVGISRREYIQHVLYVMNSRK